jgi:hypothetical protein
MPHGENAVPNMRRWLSRISVLTLEATLGVNQGLIRAEEARSRRANRGVRVQPPDAGASNTSTAQPSASSTSLATSPEHHTRPADSDADYAFFCNEPPLPSW